MISISSFAVWKMSGVVRCVLSLKWTVLLRLTSEVSLSDVRIFMIMASSRRQSREKVLVESPQWKHGNIGYIDDNDPVEVRHGRQYIRIHWENTSYGPSYIGKIQVTVLQILILHM